VLQIKRPIILLTVGLIFGIIVSELTGSIDWIFILGLVFMLSFFIIRNYLTVSLFIVCAATVLFFTGALTHFHANRDTIDKYAEFDDEYVKVKGFIDSEPDVREKKALYTIKTESVVPVDGKNAAAQESNKPQASNGRILLTIPASTNLSDIQDTLEYGTKVEFEGYLSIPQGQRNPGGFDYRKYLAGNGISATVYLSRGNIKSYGELTGSFIKRTGYNVKLYILGIINRTLSGQQAALLSGMLLGYRKGFSSEEQAAFSDAGLSHIMAVSGMHVGFIVVPLVFLFGLLPVNKRISKGMVIVILFFYALITGFTPSVTRAVIMASVVLAGRILMREPDSLASISFAAIIMLIINPFVLFEAGFQLSFCAVLSIILFYKGIKSYIKIRFIPGWIIDAVSVALAAQLGIIPVIAVHFNRVSIISLFANLLVIPFVQFIIILGFAMVLLGIISQVAAAIMGYCVHALLSYVLFMVNCAASIPYSALTVPTPSGFFIVIYYLIMLFFLWYVPEHKPDLSFKKWGRLYGSLAVVGILIVLLTVLTPGQLEVVFLDVGQGDSIFIRSSHGAAVLIDGGGSESNTSDYDVGKSVVLPFLLDTRAVRLDLVIATHSHNDHVQGLYTVLENLKVKTVAIPDIVRLEGFEKLLDISEREKVDTVRLKYSDTITLDRHTSLQILNPVEALGEDMSLNDSSIVVKLIYKNTSILLTGDIERNSELYLARKAETKDTDVLKVPHHGSDTSSGQEFLEHVNTAAAVISVGRNKFGHPSNEVIERLEKLGVKVYRTDRDGAVILISDGETIRINTVVKYKY
jgi:competence protein ComEC